MSKTFSAILTAKAPDGLCGPIRELPINDFEIEEGHLAAAEFTAHGGVLFPPQIVIAGSEEEAEERIPILIAKHCPKESGWTDHRWAICNISQELEHYRRKRFSRDHSSEFYVVSAIGFGYDANCLKEQYLVSGALSAVGQKDAYDRFKEKVIKKSLGNLPWIGGLARALCITPTDFFKWKTFWLEAGTPSHHTETLRAVRRTYQ